MYIFYRLKFAKAAGEAVATQLLTPANNEKRRPLYSIPELALK